VNAKTFDANKATKLISEADKLQKDIEIAMGGANITVLLRLKTLSKELTQIRIGLLEKPKTPEYEKFRAAVRREFLDKTLSILDDFLDLELFEEVKVALETGLR
jgi:hypothetical protein